MANTKSAERRARQSAHRSSRNRTVKSRVKTLEQNLDDLLHAGKKDEATIAFRTTCSALDKAAKTGVIPRMRADRKKSRLAMRMNRAK